MVPTRPETGYGYIVPGAPLADGGAERRALHREARRRHRARPAWPRGALWNSGLFAWTAARLFAEVRAAHARDRAAPGSALDRGDVAGFFRDVTPVSIDVGLLERSRAVAVVRGAFALGRRRHLGGARAGCAPRTPAATWSWATPTCTTRATASSGPMTTDRVGGVQDLIVVRANGRILVMPRGRAADLKQLLDALPPDIRDLP